MAEPSWQEVLRLRLAERNEREAVFAPFIEQCMSFYRPFLGSYMLIQLDGKRSKACSANKALERTKCFAIAGCELGQNESQRLDCVGDKRGRRVRCCSQFNSITNRTLTLLNQWQPGPDGLYRVPGVADIFAPR